MGNTLWIRSDVRTSDEMDHTLILKHEKILNKLCGEIGVSKLSDYFDQSILTEEYGENIEPNYSKPVELETVLTALICAIQDRKSSTLADETQIINELEDCLAKVLLAKENGEMVRSSIVP